MSKTSPAEEARLLALARRDFERANNLYEPIDGFSNVSLNLQNLYKGRTRAGAAPAILRNGPSEAAQGSPMAVTRSWEHRAVGDARTAQAADSAGAPARAAVADRRIGHGAARGLLMAAFAKTQDFPELEAKLARGELLNLNQCDELRATPALPSGVLESGRTASRGGSDLGDHRALEASAERGSAGAACARSAPHFRS